MPSPKWKLVVDIGEAEEEVPAPRIDSSVLIEQESTENATFSSAAKDNRIDQVVALLGKYMPSDPMSPLAPYVSGFMSLRLLLLRITRTVEEEELIRTMMDSYSSYASGGREQSDIAVMLARDFLYVSGAAPSTSYS